MRMADKEVTKRLPELRARILSRVAAGLIFGIFLGMGWPGDKGWADTLDHPGDLAALRALNAEWGVWNIDVAPFSLPGVTVVSNRVTRVDLSNGGLTGSISPAIGSLSELTLLNLSNNSFTGRVPSAIGLLSQLEILYLDSNTLHDSIPDMFGGMTNLQYLGLRDNPLSGPLPTSLGSASSLVYLDVSDCNLSGPIPDSLGNLQNLTQLWLRNNALHGPIPDSLGNLVNLQTLVLSGNLLRGSIPRSLGNLINLDGIFLGNNLLSGSIPESLSQISGVMTLDNNSLSGTLPANLGSFNASSIDLSGNFLNSTPDSASWQIVDGLGPNAPAIGGFDDQREDGVLIEGLATNRMAEIGSDFVKRLTLTNVSLGPITGKLLVFAQPAVGAPLASPEIEITLQFGEVRPVFFFLPIGGMGTPAGIYFYEVSFEGSPPLFGSIEVANPLLADPIGAITNFSGSATALGLDGVVRELTPNASVYQGDIVEVIGEGASLTIVFVDESSIALSNNARLIIDEYVFDPNAEEGNIGISIFRGIIMFTSGLIPRADPDDVQIETPKGGAGIRGTVFSVSASDDGTEQQTEIEVFEGAVAYTNYLTGEVTEISAGETFLDTGPLPSLETVVFGVGSPGELPYGPAAASLNGSSELALNLAGYTDRAFLVQRSTDLENWTDWRTVQASELPLSIPDSPSDARVYYRLAR